MSDVTPPNGSAPVVVAVEPFAVAPGESMTTTIHIENNASDATTYLVAIGGFEESWLTFSDHVGPIAPGQSAEVPVVFKLPPGYPSCTLVGAVSVSPLDGSSQPVSTDLSVTVEDGSLIFATLDPEEVRGFWRARFVVKLRNRGRTPTQVDLIAETQGKMRVHFERDNIVLAPGVERRVASSVRARALGKGEVKRHPYAIKVQGRSTPINLKATFVQLPLLPANAMKLLTIAAVLVLWIGAAVVGISKLSSHEQKKAQAENAANSPPPGQSSAGSGAPGSGGAGGSISSRPTSGLGPTVRLVGKVNAPAPGGITVTVTPTSLANVNTTGVSMVQPNAVLTSDFKSFGAPQSIDSAPGKLYGTMVGATFDAGLTAVAGQPTESTTTTPDGSWAIAGVKAPGTYLITFSKPGFETTKYLVTTSAGGSTLQLNASINPAVGQLSGTINGPSGPLGDVGVTITDGTITLTTRTPSQGQGIGQFSLGGLSSPDTYLVTATKPGYGTQTTTVNLAAGGNVTGVVLNMKSGVGSISGKVISDSSATGVGGVTVSATNGSDTVTATTTTTGVVGSYLLPNLPIPGKYALTISGAGWITQTQSVNLTGNSVIGASLTAAGSDVVGFAYDSAGNGLGSAGAVLANKTNTYKTLTQSTTPVGRFDFANVPAGDYVLTIQDYGYATASAPVTVTSGQVTTVSLTLPKSSTQSLNTGTVQGTVEDLFNAKGIPAMSVELDGSPATMSQSNGTYQLNNVAPGVHSITAVPNVSQDYEPASVTVNVPLNGVVVAPTLFMPELDLVSGTVTSAAGTGAVRGASLVLATNTSSTTTSSSTSSSTTTSSSSTSSTSSTSTSSTTTSSTTTSTTIPVGGVSTESVTTGADGTYSLTNLEHGQYVLTVSATGYVTQTLNLSLAADQQLVQNIVLTLQPDFNVEVFAPSSGGTNGVAQTAGICVTLTGPSGYSQTQLSTATGSITFTPLTQGGSYTASFLQPTTTLTDASGCSGATQQGTAAADTFTAEYDNTAIYSAFVAPQLPGLNVDLTFQYEDNSGGGTTGTTVDCPVVTHSGATAPTDSASTVYNSCPLINSASTPTVTISGITSFTGGGAGTPVFSSAIAANTVPIGTTSNRWSFASSSLSTFISGQVTITVTEPSSGSALESSSKTVTVTSGSSTPVSIVLTPNPVQILGTISGTSLVASSVSATVTPATIPVNSKQNATAPDSISISDSSGSLVWGDTQAGTSGIAQPGVYSFSISAAGYLTNASGTQTIGVVGGVLTGASSTFTVTLAQQTSLVVTLSGYTAISGLALATVNLMYNNAIVSSSNGGAVTVTNSGGTTTNSSSLLLSSASDTATFKYLSAGTNYSVVVTAPGYQTSFLPLTISSVGGSDPVTVPMTEQGVITGTLTGSISTGAASGLNNVTITATLNDSVGLNCTTATTTPSNEEPGYTNRFAATVTATTASDGSFVLSGTSAIGGNVNGGLCTASGSTYTISASVTGYSAFSLTSSTLTAGINAVGTTNITANAFTQVIHVVPSAGKFDSSALPTLSVSNSLGTSYTCIYPTVANGCTPAITGSGNNVTAIDFTLATTYPTSYNYTLGAPNFAPLYLSAISYAPGATPATLSETLETESLTVTGVVTAGSSNTPVPNLQIDLLTGCTGSATATATTNHNGLYTINNVAGNTYCVEPDTSTGYADSGSTADFTFTTSTFSLSTTENITAVAVALTSVNVTLSTTGGYSNLTGATVTLTPQNSGSSTCTNTTGSSSTSLISGLGTTLTQTPGTATASFTSVTPDYYTVSISASAIPTQSTTAVTICPTSSPSTTVAIPFAVDEGQISGTITVEPQSLSTNPSVNITGGTSTAATVNCTTVSGSSTTPESCTFFSYALTAHNYTVAVSLSGYVAPSSQTTGSLTSSGDTTLAFTLDLNSAPTIASFLPSTAGITANISTVITGTNFVMGTGVTVTFTLHGGSTHFTATVTAVTADGTQLTVTTPDVSSTGAGSYDVNVTTPGGNVTDPSSFTFT